MPSKPETLRPLKILLHGVFFLSGITTVLIGQILPILSRKFSLNDLEAGYFFPAQFAGSLFGTFLTRYFGRNDRYILATLIGCVLMAAGILLMNAGTFAVCLAGFAVNGIGIGLTLPTVNILILELNPMRSAAALSLLNFFWGAGAIVCKPFVDVLSGGRSITLTTIAIAMALLILAVLIATLPKGVEPRRAEPEPGTDQAMIPIWTTPLAWALALFNFVHVGFESGMGGWLTTYTERIDASASLDFLSPIFLYFFFFVAGRGVAPLFFRVANENAVLVMSLLVILAGLVITLTADNVFMLGIGAAVSGFGTSSIFPTNVSRFGRVFGPESIRRATPLFISGTLGGALVTWLIGFFSNQTEDLRYGMFVLGGSVVLLLILQIGLIIRGTGPIR